MGKMVGGLMDQRIGEFSKHFINEKLNSKKAQPLEQLQKIVEKVGPGYERFRMEEYLQHFKHLHNDRNARGV